MKNLFDFSFGFIEQNRKRKLRAPRLGAFTHKSTLNFKYYDFIVVNTRSKKERAQSREPIQQQGFGSVQL